MASSEQFSLLWRKQEQTREVASADSVLVALGEDDVALRGVAEAAQRLKLRGRVFESNTGPRTADQWLSFWREAPSSESVSVVVALGSNHEQLQAGQLPVDRIVQQLLLVEAACAGLKKAKRSGRVHVLTRASRIVVDGEEPRQFDLGLSHGLGAELALRYADQWGSSLDLALEPGPEDFRVGLAELCAEPTKEEQRAVRSGTLFGLRAVSANAVEAPLAVTETGTYLVTGALGAIGQRLVLELRRQGASSFLLLGRTPEEDLSSSKSSFLGRLRDSGAQVSYRACDCSKASEVKEALESIGGATTIRGVIHAAGVVLSHENELSAASLEGSVNGKFLGAWTLHTLLRETDLDFFQVLSSVSSLWGTEGYGAYAAANGGANQIVALRRSLGLPAEAILLGPWAEGGMAGEELKRQLTRIGVGAVMPESGLPVLLSSTTKGEGARVLCPLQFESFLPILNARRSRPLFSECSPGASASREAQRDERVALGEEEIRQLVLRELRRVLGHEEREELSVTAGFFELGLDSVMAVDLSQALKGALKLDVQAADIFDYPTVERLSSALFEKNSTSLKRAPKVRIQPPTPVPVAVTEAEETDPGEVSEEPSSTQGAEPIAIVGMAGTFPGANNLDEYWSALESGRDCVANVPQERWDGEAFHDASPLAQGKVATDQGGFVARLAEFDARFFGMSSREAENLDPQHRLLLQQSWHALEDAAIDPHSLRDSAAGVFVGISNSDYAHLLERRGYENLDAFYATGTSLNAAAGRLSHYLGLQGPALAIDTACSSSLTALHLAIRSLRSGETDLALTGGVNAIVTPTISVVASRAHMLSPDGRCKTFSDEANGYVRAEGCGVLVLKRLSDARRDGDRVLALIRGSALNQDGASAGLTVPNGQAQARVIRDALSDARLKPQDVAVLEAHGTGTRLGDPIEVRAAAQAYRGEEESGEPLLIGSGKSNIGHCESAAGVAGVIKLVLSLIHDKIPATLHCGQLNREVDWESLPIEVLQQERSWAPADQPRRAAISGFGFSGTNAHLILEEAPAEPLRPATEAKMGVLPLSAASEEALAELRSEWAARLDSATPAETQGLLTIARSGRASLPYRTAALGKTSTELAQALREASSETRRTTSTPRVGFLFTGQGSQYLNMGRTLFSEFSVFRKTIERCSALFLATWGVELEAVLFGDDREQINNTCFAQPLLYALQVGLCEVWRALGVIPSVVLGHSVGEIAAAACAGVFSIEDGMRLVLERGRIMQEVERGSMVALSCDSLQANELASKFSLDVAVQNGPQAFVLSGASDAVQRLVEHCKSAGIQARPLVVSHAFHSRMMEPALSQLRQSFSELNYRSPELPIVQNVGGGLASEGGYDAGYWLSHVRGTVRFFDGAQVALERADVFVEIGPEATLGKLLERSGCAPTTEFLPSLRRGRDELKVFWSAVVRLFQWGADLNWGQLSGPRGALKTNAPRYPFARVRHFPETQERIRTSIPWNEEVKSPGLTGAVRRFALSSEYPPYVRDHRLLDGRTVIAGAAQVAVTISALLAGQAGLRLRDVHFPQALVIEPGRQYELQVCASEDRVRSVSHDGASWTEHLSCSLGTPDALPSSPPSALDPRERHEALLNGTQVYDYMSEKGYALAPSFRWIREAWVRGTEGLIRYSAPEELTGGDLHELHPGLIDSFFQAAVIFAVDEDAQGDGKISIPYAVKELTLHRVPKSGEQLFAKVSALEWMELPRGRRDVTVATIDVFSEEGLVLSAERLRLRKADKFAFSERDATETTVFGIEPLSVSARPSLGWSKLSVIGEPPAQIEPLLSSPGEQVDFAADARPCIVDTRLATLDRERPDANWLAEIAETLRSLPHDARYFLWLGQGENTPAFRGALRGLLGTAQAENVPVQTVCFDAPAELGVAALSDLLRQDWPENCLTVTWNGEEWQQEDVGILKSLRTEVEPPGVVVITGGVHGLGLSAARLMTELGAQQVLLVGRRAPSAEILREIEALNTGTTVVEALHCDVTEPGDCSRLIGLAQERGDLTHVFHLAGALGDAAFENVTSDHFQRTFEAKVEGLEVMLRALGTNRPRLVFFSSLSALIPNRGQSAYAAANGALWGMAEQLRAEGWAASAVAWGPWVPDSGRGMAAGLEAAMQGDIKALRDDQALAVLRHVLAAPSANVAVLEKSRDANLSDLVNSSRSGRSRHPGNSQSQVVPKGAWMRAQLEVDGFTEANVQALLSAEICDVLGEDELDETLEFVDMGLDSITSIDLRSKLAAGLDLELPATVALDYPDLDSLASHLLEQLVGQPRKAGNVQ